MSARTSGRKTTGFAPQVAAAYLFMERLAFIRDTAGDVSRDGVRNWRGWRGWRASAELHAFALQDDPDRVVEMLDAPLCGDDPMRPCRMPSLSSPWSVRAHPPHGSVNPQ